MAKETDRDRSRGWYLEEVVGGSACDMGFSSSGSRIELQEGVFHVLVKFHDGGLVAAAVAVVGGREDGHHTLLMAPVVAFHDELVSTGNESQAIRAIELF